MSKVQSWHLLVCGINHDNSTSDERGPLQIGNDDIARAHSVFSALPGIMESTILSTCNRIEFYFIKDNEIEPFEILQSFYMKLKDLNISPLRDKFYIKKGKHVAEHLFKVSAGMDSMVLGENEIYSSACSVKAAGKIIHRMFHQAFRAGKQVRADTEMGKGACSVSTAAAGLVKSKIGKSDRPDILFIGINKMISLAAESFARSHHGRFVFANRTLSNIDEIARRYDAEAHSLEKLPELLADVDIVFTSTASAAPIITKEIIEKAIQLNEKRFKQSARKLLIVDIAVPGDVEIDNAYNPMIDIFRIEDVEDHIKDLQNRQQLAIPQAEAIIEKLRGEFAYWYNHIRFEPIYNGLGKTFEEIRRQEMDKVLEMLPDDLRGRVKKASDSLTNRLLHLKARTTENKE
jgi:glutamyl-tRNA reductase